MARPSANTNDVAVRAVKPRHSLQRKIQQLESEIAERKILEREMRGAKEAAEGASRAKSEFLANMSHELRTPLNGVVGMIELLRSTELEEQQQRYAEICRTSADSLLSLINDILDLSKIEAGKLELDFADFELGTMIEDVADVFAQKAAGKGLELACFIDPRIPAMVRGDKDRLRQILINLVNNAIKFTEHGEVVLRVWPEKTDHDHVVVRTTVKDTGIGIGEKDRARLFKTFSQLDSSRTKKYGGTGLGLAICKRLAELMDGQIGVESEEAKGSTFWFTTRLQIQPDQETTPVTVPTDLRGLRVLIVDDNATNRLILFEQVVGWGMEAETAESGDAALQLLKHAAVSARKFDLALLDMAMPNMDGLQLAQAIHNRPEFQPIAMLMLTSFDDVVDQETRTNVGIDACLRKPTRQAEVFNAVVRAVSRSKATEEPQGTPDRPALGDEPDTGDTSTAMDILIAEDNEVNQIVACEILKTAGFHSDMVADGHEAVTAAKRKPYGLILMDCQMPQMDGFEATRLIRDLEQKGDLAAGGPAHLPIVALTANAIKGDRERCLDAGMDDYLAKPIEPALLIKTIQTHLAVNDAPAPKDQEEAITTGEPGALNETAHANETVESTTDTASPETDQPPPFDGEALLARCMNDAGFVTTILTKFESDAASLLEQVDQTMSGGDHEMISRVAHTIKGSAASMSAEALRSIAAELETLAKVADVEGAQRAADELRRQLTRCIEFVPTMRDQMAQNEA